MSEAIQRLLKRLEHPALPGIDLGLERVLLLLDALDNPHAKLPPVVHVAGTNGKGSVLAYLTAVLQQAGLRVHRYTSPHLVRFNERIMLAGEDIDDERFEDVLQRVAAKVKEFSATSFEATTAAAFLAFAETPADVLLLETGMGGRLDATNVIEKPLLTAITPIGYDHTHFLGSTLSEIASEKAGILKAGIPCVVGPQPLEAMRAIEKAAEKIGAPLFCHALHWRLEDGYYMSHSTQGLISPALAGEHQYMNAGLAAACCELLVPHFGLLPRHIEKGIASAKWPARLQHLKTGALAESLPEHTMLWLDGGHNPHAAEVLASWAQTRHPRKVGIICGMLNTKDALSFLMIMAPHIDAGVAVDIEGHAESCSAEQMFSTMQQVGIHAKKATSLPEALQTLDELLPQGEADILCCGSLALAGQVLADNAQGPER